MKLLLNSKLVLIVTLMFTLIMLPLVSSYMPPTHKLIQDTIISELQSDSDLFQSCKSDPDLCFGGNILSDFSVVYYLTEGKLYQITHQPSFCQSMLDQATNPTEQICAVGACLHQTQDLPSHEIMVPYSIGRTGLVNSVIHTFSEQHLDNIVQKKSPNIKSESLDVSRWNECRPLFKRVLLGFNEYQDKIASGEFDRVFDRFLSEIEGSVTSYDVVFKSKKSFIDNIRVIPPLILGIYVGLLLLWILLFVLLIFRKNKNVFNWISIIILIILIILQGWLFIANLNGVAFDTFVNIISPVSNLVPIGDANSYIDIAVQNGKNFFIEGERSIIGKDGSGFDKLAEADRGVIFIDLIILGVIVILIFAFIFFNFRRSSKSKQGINL